MIHPFLKVSAQALITAILDPTAQGAETTIRLGTELYYNGQGDACVEATVYLAGGCTSDSTGGSALGLWLAGFLMLRRRRRP